MEESLRQKIISIVKNYLNNGEECHSFDHTLRVRCQAVTLARSYPELDMSLIEVTSYFHDLGRGVGEKVGKHHGIISGELAASILPGLGFSTGDVSRIICAIEEHPFSQGRIPSTLMGRILQDADRLDALGAIGIARVFMFGHSRPLYDIEDPFARGRQYDDEQFTIDHFYTKLLKLPDTLHTPQAREIATRRVAFMQKFLDEFALELDCNRKQE